MPTTHVQPGASETLQHIANSLLKARKVVVVTGAGISTNSGIPDFRSENGLYSLIQAQFDAAARQARLAEQDVSNDKDGGDKDKDNIANDVDNGRRSKRRRVSCDAAADSSILSEDAEAQIQAQLELDSARLNDLPTSHIQDENQQLPPTVTREAANGLPLVTPRPNRRSLRLAQPMTSPLSSPPPEDLIVPPTGFRKHHHSHLADIIIPPSSSPLSSPPPVLFDPFEPESPSEGQSSRRSTSPSEVDDSPSANQLSLSQPLNPGKNTLPNMKGKDLFDAAIWSDPLRTSVFYTFATTLRQKVKDIEPTSSHRFISHLRDRGKLVRCYTQNIDQIEEKVGLSTSLQDGPGSRGRFSRRSTANANQLNKMVEEASICSTDQCSTDTTQQNFDSEAAGQQSQSTQSEGTETPPTTETEPPLADAMKPPPRNPRRETPRSGVECVFLHGSLELLRCFLCGRVCTWDEDKELETMSGQQPECPHCVGATTAREERGKRALGVGKLRPDIVLYGEEHPNSHLISPIVTHDLALSPDLLLILGTSLRVHGLKVMVREFAKAVHTKGGKVVFVNFTKPPESSWGDVIDYWIEWDCDAWVADLQDKIPKLWQDPEPPKPKKKRESTGDGEKPEKPPAANPVALRDTKVTGAYWTLKIVNELHRISGEKPPDRRASISVPATSILPGASTSPEKKVVKPKMKRPRKSAPGALERPKQLSSTLNPNHGRSRRKNKATEPAETSTVTTQPSTPEKQERQEKSEPANVQPNSSIIESVKSNPRRRKRKKIDGEEVIMPTVGRRRTIASEVKMEPGLRLPPLKPQPLDISTPWFVKPLALEPRTPSGPPLAPISVNMRFERDSPSWNPFFYDDPLVGQLNRPPTWQRQITPREATLVIKRDSRPEETDAILALTGLRKGTPIVHNMPSPSARGFDSDLRRWGTRWSCKR
ncbi:DHS-like NAD/FAD-binding domain-containing protein [Mariannaea sp. PMI_226]|nr:DHS-like NAD/FAD-binding domain-containing protein [Mariannaea sp. PMI_226]